MDQASAAFKAAIGAVESSNLAGDAKTKLKKDIEKVMRPLASKVDSSSTKLEDGKCYNKVKIVILIDYEKSVSVKVDGEPIACPKISCPSKQFPNFSVSLAVVYNAQVGRHVVAKRKIKAGETLCVEEPLSSFLDLAERGKSTCSHCFNQVWDPLPSPISTQVSVGFWESFLNHFLLRKHFCQKHTSSVSQDFQVTNSCLCNKENAVSFSSHLLHYTNEIVVLNHHIFRMCSVANLA